MRPPRLDLRALGVTEEQAADLRARLAAFSEDWDRAEMDRYDDYDTALQDVNSGRLWER